MVLPLPCEPAAPSATTPVAHGLPHGVKHAVPHIHRHAVHAAHHAVRTALKHPKLIAGAACRAAPLLVASNILAVPLPVEPPPATVVQPVAMTQPVQSDPGLLLPPLLPGSAVDPIRTVLPASEVAKLALIEPLPGAPVSVSRLSTNRPPYALREIDAESTLTSRRSERCGRSCRG